MKLAIAICTYKRNDGTTPKFLNRALDSIKNQTHKDYKVFLMGDDYTDEEEFETFGNNFQPNQIFKKNLPFSVERNRYSLNSKHLWYCGGANAQNILIEEILSQGYDYVCRMDHDDYWAPNHLEEINKVIETEKENISCVYTCSEYKNRYTKKNITIPEDVQLNGDVHEKFPKPCNVAHSSTCINYRLIPLRYRDVFYETGKELESDIDMWNRLEEYSIKNNLRSFLVAKSTCFHLEEYH